MATPSSSAISALLKRVKQLELSVRRRVDAAMVGHYASAFRGHGMQFSDTREYVFGDDVRHIAWNISARAPTTQMKRFEEERELRVLIALDMSASSDFGGRDATVMKRMIDVAASLALAGVRSQDQVGALLFTSEVEKTVPMKKGAPHVLRILREILAFQPRRRTTDLHGIFHHLEKKINKKTLIFVISDFIADLPAEKILKTCSRRHEIILISVPDPFESALPYKGLLRLQDPETGTVRIVDASSTALRRSFQEKIVQHRHHIRQTCLRSGLTLVELNNPDNDMILLKKFLISRKGRQGFSKAAPNI